MIANNIKNGFYRSIILDIDGVVFDSNKIKEKNIYNATLRHTNKPTAELFSEYFVLNNGIPREVKIYSFFQRMPEIARKVLNDYNELNNKTLYVAEPTRGVVSFLKAIFGTDRRVFALSGGVQAEVKYHLCAYGLDLFFNDIYGGPVTKDKHISVMPLEFPAVFIGDSKVDILTAKNAGLDFLFMYGYTQFHEWQFYCRLNEVETIMDLSYLLPPQLGELH